MNTEPTVVAEHEGMGATGWSYMVGFGLSLVLTVTAYVATTRHTISHAVLVAVLVALALVQFMVQLVFFLHLGVERKPRWKSMVLLLMLLVVGILVFGSLWIMNNLNYNMQNFTPQQQDTYLHNHEGI